MPLRAPADFRLSVLKLAFLLFCNRLSALWALQRAFVRVELRKVKGLFPLPHYRQIVAGGLCQAPSARILAERLRLPPKGAMRLNVYLEPKMWLQQGRNVFRRHRFRTPMREDTTVSKDGKGDVKVERERGALDDGRAGKRNSL